MINAIHLEQFKCFEKISLPLRRLTLLTGFNAAGKSTVTQSLLILAQTMRQQPVLAELVLNGPLVALGTPGEVVNQRTNVTSILIGVDADEFSWHQRFHVAGESPRRYLAAASANKTLSEKVETFKDDENVRGFLSGLIYIGATRHTDRQLYPVGDNSLSDGECGTTGEFAPWLFYLHGEDQADAALSFGPGESTGTVRKELNGWMQALFTGAEANVSLVQEADRMKLEFRTSVVGEWQRPANVGFGLSYAFPLLAAGVLSSRRQTLVIDSPEAHLHPSGQSLMGRFSAQVASTGRQMLVETHSDHYLNGVRLAIRDGLIAPEDVAIYFFRQNSGISAISELAIDRYGNLSGWPEGFFDQAERDLAALGGWN